MSDALETLRAELEAAGWRVYNDSNAAHYNNCKWYAGAKLADGAPDCASNRRPPGLCISPFSTVFNGLPFEQVEFSVTGDADGIWLCLKAYSIPIKDAMASIPKVRAMLCAAWTAAAKAGA